MRNNFSLILLTLWMPIAGAQTATDLSAISVGELGKVQSETILFKAKAERAKAELEANGTLPSPPASDAVSYCRAHSRHDGYILRAAPIGIAGGERNQRLRTEITGKPDLQRRQRA